MKKILILFASIVLFASCKKDKNENPAPNEEMKQYADAVLGFSTEYRTSPNSWSAYQALGKPNVYPNYGDITEAWASANSDGRREFLVLSFDTIQTVKKIEIYETYKPGAVDTLYVRNATTGQWNQVWANTAQAAPEQSRIFAVDIPETPYKVNAVRIAINSPAVSGYNEIDAVAITGKK